MDGQRPTNRRHAVKTVKMLTMDGMRGMVGP